MRHNPESQCFPSYSYRNGIRGYEKAGHLTTQHTRSESIRGCDKAKIISLTFNCSACENSSESVNELECLSEYYPD